MVGAVAMLDPASLGLVPDVAPSAATAGAAPASDVPFGYFLSGGNLYRLASPSPTADMPHGDTAVHPEDKAAFLAGVPSDWAKAGKIPTVKRGAETGAEGEKSGSAPAASVGRAPDAASLGLVPAVEEAPAKADVPPAPGHLRGGLANAGAGANEALAGLVGMPVDLATGALNLPVRAINALAGTHLPTIDAPVGGSDWWKSALGLIGADPRNVEAPTIGERMARGAGAGVAGAVLPLGPARVGAQAVGAALGPVAGGVTGAMGQGGALGQGVIGGAGGLIGQAAEEAAPEPLKPLANLAGQVVGGIGTAAGGAALRGVGGAAGQFVRDAVAPLSVGTKEAVLDPSGAPILDSHGNPLRATQAQQQLAAQKIAAATGQTPQQLASSIPTDQVAVPGVTPSLGALTGNTKILGLERTLRTKLPTPFNEAEAQNANAQTLALRSVGPGVETVDGRVSVQPSGRGGRFDIMLDGEKIGTAQVEDVKGGSFLDHISIDTAQQGKGLGRPIYDAIEQASGRRLLPSPMGLSDEASRLWASRLARMSPNQRAAMVERSREAGRALGVPEAELSATLDPLLTRAAEVPEAWHEAVTRFVDGQLAAIEHAEQVAGAAERAELRRLDEALPASRTSTEEASARQQYGAAIRQKIEDAYKAASRRVSALFDAFDPEKKLALAIPEYRAAAAALQAEILPGTGAKLGDFDGPLIAVAEKAPDVVTVQHLKQARETINANLRKARQAGDDMAARRLTLLKQGIDRDFAAATAEQVHDEAPFVQSGQIPQERSTLGRLAELAGGEAAPAPAVGASVFTPSGREIGVRYRVVDAGDLVTSHTPDGTVNPAYPAELQPRDRGRQASQQQIARIAGDLKPELLGGSATVNEGAPIIGPDGVVESGNGRTMAIQRAYAEGGASAASYRQWLEAQGYDTAGMKRPVLVRERTTPLSPDERVSYAQEAAAPTGLSMSATEKAVADAKRISNDALALWNTGDVGSVSNLGFVRSVVRDIAEKGEEGAFYASRGTLSLEGAQRIRNALLQRAYGDPDLVAALAETGDESIKAFGSALTDAAGDFARLRAAIDAGAVDGSVDLAPHLVDAARLIAEAKARRISLKDAVGQADLIGGAVDPLTSAILHAAYGSDLTGRLSRANMATLLRFYTEEAAKQGTTPRLFGANARPEEILAEGASRGRTARAVVPAGEAGNGPGADASGAQARGPGLGAAGQDAAGAGVGSASAVPGASAFNGGAGAGAGQGAATGASGPRAFGDRGIAPGNAAGPATPSLTPNVTPEDAAVYRAANAGHAEKKQNFAGAPDAVMATQPAGAPYKVPDSGVGAKFFPGGPGEAETTQSLVKTLGRDEARQVAREYLAFDLREAARNGAGDLDDAALARWMAKRNEGAFATFPELRTEFGSLGAAQEQITRAAEAAMAQKQEFLASAARFFIGKDPSTAITKLMASANPAAEAADLMRMTAGNKEARRGLQAALAEWMIAKARSTAEAGTSGEKQIAGAAFQRLIATPKIARALEKFYTPEQIDALKTLGANIERAARAWNATKIPGSPGTAADLMAAGHGSGMGSILMQMLIGEGAGELATHATGASGATGWMLRAGAMAGGVAYNLMRQAGLRTVDELMAQALLNPEVLRLLAAKAPTSAGSAIWPKLRAALANLSLSGAAQAGGRQFSLGTAP